MDAVDYAVWERTKESSPLTTEIYAVEDFTQSPVDETSGEFDFSDFALLFEEETPARTFGLNFSELQASTSLPYYTEQLLAQCIKDQIAKESWLDLPTSALHYSLGKLMITQRSEVHQQIAAFLSLLREERRRKISVEATFVTYKNNFLKQVELCFTPLYLSQNHSTMLVLYAIFDQEKERAFFLTTNQCKDAGVFKNKTLTVSHAQEQILVQSHQTQFLAGYGNGDKDMVGKMEEGVCLQIRPLIDLARREVLFQIGVTIAMIMKPIPSLPLAGGEIAVPNQVLQKVQCELTVPLQQTVILAGFANPFEEKGDRSYQHIRKKENLMIALKANLV